MGAFLVRRSVRLDPPYWASIVLMIGYLALHATLSSKLTEWPTLPQLAAHVFYMQELLGYRELNVVYWTLCIEFQFYISFAIFVASAAAVARSRGEAPSRSVAAAGTVLFLVSTLWPAGIVSWLATPEFLFPHLHAFFAGAVTAWAMGGALPNRHWLACALALAVAVVVHPNVPSSVVLGTMVALHVAARRGAMATWLSARPLQYLGRISYSLYLVHVPISVTLLGIRVRLAPESNVAAVIFQLLVFALSIAAAHLLHVSIEAPCIRVSKKLKEQWSVGASTVAVPAAPAEAAFEAPT